MNAFERKTKRFCELRALPEICIKQIFPYLVMSITSFKLGIRNFQLVNVTYFGLPSPVFGLMTSDFSKKNTK